MRTYLRGSLAIGLGFYLAACSKGGQLTLEPGARIVKAKGAPTVRVDLGGKALIVQENETPSTGVHGWVSIQTVAARNMTDTSGNTMILNKPAPRQ